MNNNNDNDEYQEIQKYGSKTLEIYFEYFKVSAGVLGLILNFTFLISSQILITATDYWINNWASSEEKYTNNEFKKFNDSFERNKTLDQILYIENRFFNYQIYTSNY